MHRRQRRATNLNLPGKVKTGAPGGGVAVRQPLCTSFLFIQACTHSNPPNEHTSEGGRDDRGVPYHAESTLSSAQVLK